MSKVAIVTGAGGFMGSHLMDYLSNEGTLAIGIDDYSTGFESNTPDDQTVFKLDLVSQIDYVQDVIEKFKPDIVYHLAAWAHEGLSQFCPMRITENNYNATLNLLTECINNNVPKFVFTSSMSVYGDQEAPFDESMKNDPVDIYGIAKSASEKAIQQLSKVYGYDYTIIRPHNVYGPRQNMSDPYRNVAGIFIRRALEGKNLVVYGDGTQTRAFSYIDDVTPYIAKAGWDKNVSNEILNVGPREEYSINSLAREVIKHFPEVKIEYVPDRPLEVKHAYCTNTKISKLMGYKTKTEFKDGISKMVEWAKELYENDGLAKPRYLDELEITNDSTPQTWTEKSL